MKRFAIVCGLLLLSSLAIAQSNPPSSVEETIHKGTLDLNAFVSGGSGVGGRSDDKFFYAGGHFGWVLSSDHGGGRFRGNFEWAGDVIPIYVVFQPDYAAKGGSITPVIWRWNFTRGKRIAPYIQAAGGLLVTTRDLPQFTYNVNFTPQGGGGVHFFVRDHQAITAEVSAVHISNASLGDHNSGINASIHFRLGYTWFR